jgi:putative NADH-flavin reductase
LLLGATGGTGLQIIEQGLKLGYNIKALVRSPEKITTSHENLFVIKGNPLDAGDIAKALEGNDVLVTALGVPNLMFISKTTLYSDSARAVAEDMKLKGASRLVCVSAGLTGLKDPNSKLPFFVRYIMGPFVWRTMYQDMAIMEQIFMDSGLDWTIVRPPRLADLPLKGDYAESDGFDVPGGKMTLGRADLADLVLKTLEDNEYIGKAVAVAYTARKR